MIRSSSKILEGRPASKGIGIGKTRVFNENDKVIHPEKIHSSEAGNHLEKVNNAKNSLNSDFEKLKELTEDPEARNIMEAQIQSLNDPELDNLIKNKIKNEHYSAKYAIFSSFNQYIELLENSESEWAIDRTIDLSSIRNQFIKAVENKKDSYSVEPGDVIFALEISPMAMIQISDVKIAGIVLQKAGPTSHAVILSQSLGIPCVIGAHWNQNAVSNNRDVIIDGSAGQVILYPDEEDITKYKALQKKQESELKSVLKWATKPNITECGFEFIIRANIEFLEELPRLASHGAEGVGLLRTETILFEAREFDVQDQVQFYESVLNASDDNPVTIRLFDAGGDKLISDFETEANPFLGWRGIRMLLDNKPLLKRQLEAIYRVSGTFNGRVKLLVPMISGIEEIEAVKEVCSQVTEELTSADVPFDKNMEFGVMIEVPSAVMMAETIARHVDFFSIGTNDLTQYTLAVDRGNDKISDLFDSYHPSVWKLIKKTADAALKQGIDVSVCGEMASKPEAAACLLGMGISELSMNPGAIPRTKSVLCNRTHAEMTELSDQVLKSERVVEVHRLINDWVGK